MHVKKDDLVVIQTGDDAEMGRARKVLRVLPDVDKVVVEGVNRVYKHLKPSRGNAQGGRLSKSMPVAASNVALIDPTTNKPTRVAVKYKDDGSKVLVAKKSGTVLRTLVDKPNPKYAKKK